MAQKININKSLAGKNVLISGCTGFIGKALVEKILWAQPDIGSLILVIRAKDLDRAKARVKKELFDSNAFARIRYFQHRSWDSLIDKKLKVVCGDLVDENIGLTELEYARLCANVDVIINCAATVTFDTDLDTAYLINSLGPLRLMAMAKASGNIPFVQVSTCFVNGRIKGQALEKFVEPLLDGNVLTVADAISIVEGEINASKTKSARPGKELAQKLGFADVYTLTKSLGELLLEQQKGSSKLTIVRPAIVESALLEPTPGWIENVRVADAILSSYARGLMKDVPGQSGQRLDLVPVDKVVNAIIAATAELLSFDNSQAEETRIYQVSSNVTSPTLKQFLEYAQEGLSKYPIQTERPIPNPTFTDINSWRRELERKLTFLKLVASFPLKPKQIQEGVRTLEQALFMVELYEPYLRYAAEHDNANLRCLEAKLDVESLAVFSLSCADIDWKEFVSSIHVPGLRRYAMHLENGFPIEARDAVISLHKKNQYPSLSAKNIYELFEISAGLDPEIILYQTRVGLNWVRYSYGDVKAAVCATAELIRAKYKIEQGDRIALLAPSHPFWAITSLAILKLGATLVPIDPQWKPNEIKSALEFAEVSLLIVHADLDDACYSESFCVEHLDDGLVPSPSVAAYLKAAKNEEPATQSSARTTSADDTAIIIFTSGTSGTPKAVPLTHGNFISAVADAVATIRMSAERTISVLPLHHVFEFGGGMLVNIATNGSITYLSKLEANELNQMMVIAKPTRLLLVPRILELLRNGMLNKVKEAGPAVSAVFKLMLALSRLSGGRLGPKLFKKVHLAFGGNLKSILSGGAAAQEDLIDFYETLGFAMMEGYGLTETSIAVAVSTPGDKEKGTIGKVLPSVELKLLNNDAEYEDGVGEILVRGPSITKGYYKNSLGNSASFLDGWFRTGDLGKLSSAGNLSIVGRTKNVIVTSSGKNVYPEEVEFKYNGLPAVVEVCVLGMPEEGTAAEVVCGVFVVDKNAAEDSIKMAIRERGMQIPGYQRISRVELWEGDLPKTSTLKVKRNVLREMLLRGDKPFKSSTPVTPQPEALDSIWLVDAVNKSIGVSISEFANIPLIQIKPDMDLIELGIDSIMRAGLIGKLESQLKISLPDKFISEIITVSDIVHYARSECGERSIPEATAV